jgi:hypothetical protein
VCRRTLPDCVAKSLTATTRGAQKVDIDGVLDEAAWAGATFMRDFTQTDPVPGAPPTVVTEVAFLYDADALYVGARMYSADPSQIRAITSRRDTDGNSERLIVSIDSYQDRRNAFTFGVTAAGVRLDYKVRDDNGFHRDRSWNPVWAANAKVDSLGWTAEMRIPYSQIRFNKSEVQTWGINVNRYIPNNNEDLFWIAIPKQESGWPSWFGDLTGMTQIEPRRPVEFFPYVAAGARQTSNDLIAPGDPFRKPAATDTRFGADIKMGIGPSLTFDATVNPDFGQVEVDPAEVNLSEFPTFFEERRPFFLEGRELLSANGLFYSRRIGAPPSLSPAGDFVDSPRNTTIIAAGKLTGRTPSGLSLGALVAGTANEYARTYDAATGAFDEIRVEPVTTWGVLSAKQQFGASASTIGVAVTGLKRDVTPFDPLAQLLIRRALAGGVDWNLRFKGGDYQLSGLVNFSDIRGEAGAVDEVQTFSSHYFQRPDADYLDYDPTRTSLGGYRVFLAFERTSAEHWLWEVETSATSPGFDINEVGRLERADRVSASGELEYRETVPGPLFYRYSVSLRSAATWNFGGDRMSRDVMKFDTDWTLNNLWSFGTGFDVRPRAYSDTQTRGGPLMATSSGWTLDGYLRTDRRKRTIARMDGVYRRDELGGWSYGFGGSLSLQPGGAWQISVSPFFSRSLNMRQYVTTRDGGSAATYGGRYIFGAIDRSTLSTQIRLEYAFTPNLSLNVYVEPFTSTGAYSDYGELAAARTFDLRLYGTDGTTISEEEGPPDLITVTDGDDEFSFFRADFDALSFNSNVVLRWEWRLGSTLFLIWQQNRGRFEPVTDPGVAGPGGFWDGLSAPGQNIFALKVSYWVPI